MERLVLLPGDIRNMVLRKAGKMALSFNLTEYQNDCDKTVGTLGFIKNKETGVTVYIEADVETEYQNYITIRYAKDETDFVGGTNLHVSLEEAGTAACNLLSRKDFGNIATELKLWKAYREKKALYRKLNQSA